MTIDIQFKRGTKSNIDLLASKARLSEGEPLFATDEDKLYIANSPSTYTSAVSSLSNPNGSADIGYLPSGTGAVATNVQSKLRETVSVFDFMTKAQIAAVQAGTSTDDTSAIQAAVTHCFTTGDQLYWPDGTYLTTASITNFHAVRHVGPGAVQRGSDIYRVQPGDTNTNILYVSTTGSASNDALSASQPTTIAKAFNIIKALGAETLNGIWRIQMAAGTYNDAGIVLDELPLFKNKLEIFGASVNETTSAVPTTIWDGTVSGSSYALRLDSSLYPSASANLFIKNIKLQDWTAGGIVIWSDGNVLVRNIHIDNCPIGMWLRHGYFKVMYGVVNNCSTWGIGVQYNATGNIGTATVGTGVTFTNCADGVQVGRYTVCYVQRCTFTNCDRSIEGEWLARVRPVYNTFNTPNSASITLRGNSLLTTGPGENTLPTLTEALPYHRSESGSVNPDISRYGQRCLHNYSGVTLEQGLTPVTLFSVTTTSQILLSDNAYGGSDFVPFRLPAYALFSPTFELEVELGVALNANAGGTLALHGQGSSLATKLCEITIPTATTYRRGNLHIKVKNTPNNTSARYEIHFPVTGLYVEGATGSLNDVLIRDSSDSQLLFRLYWTSATVDQVQFFNMRTYVTE